MPCHTPRAALLTLVLGSALAAPAAAHDPGLSRAAITVDDTTLRAELGFARRDLEPLMPIDVDGDGRVTHDERAIGLPALAALAHEALRVESDGETLVPEAVAAEIDADDSVLLHLVYPLAAPARLQIAVPLLERLSRGHRQYMTVDSAGDAHEQRLLARGAAPLEIALGAAGTTRSRAGFLVLGLEHILEGWDHLLFLVVLLLARGTLRTALACVTAFTAAHSVTLALAALDVVRVPATIVEPAIAASIVWVGVQNLLRRDAGRRWPAAFGFGLVHGLGFASALADAGVGSRSVGDALTGLLCFNLGVEAGQLAVTALVLPCLAGLARLPLYPRLAGATSAASAACGMYWLVERTLS